MLLSAITASVMKAGELFLSGCIVGYQAFNAVKEATKKVK